MLIAEAEHTGGLMKRIVIGIVLIIGLSTIAVFAQREEPIQPADVYIRTVKIALANKEWARVTKSLTACLKHYPENYEAHFYQGVVWAEKDEIDSMVMEFGLARQYAGGKLKNIKKEMENIELDKYEYNFNDGVKYINIADSLERDASEIVSDSVSAHSTEQAHLALGLARDAFHNCTAIMPDDFRGWLNMGIAYDRKREYQESAEHYRISEDLFHRVELGDTTTDFYDTTLFFQGEGENTEQFKELLKTYKKQKEDMRSRYKALLTALGGVYFELTDYANCAKIFRRLLGFYEEDLAALEYIGSSFQQLGMSEEALKWTEMILRKNPDDKDRLFNVAVHWYNAGVENRRQYEALIRRILSGENEPGLQEAADNKKEEYITNFTRAVQFLDGVLKLDDGDVESWKLKGASLYFLENYEEAIPALTRSRELIPDDMSICQMLRECYRLQENFDQVMRLTEECGL